MSRLRIVLGDDHTLVLSGLCSLLQPHHEVVGSAADGRQLVELAIKLKPDVVISDISMPLLNGLEAAAQIREAVPTAKLVFLTMHANPMYLRRALDAGASAYLLKSGLAEELLIALDKVVSGGVHVSPGFGDVVLENRWNRSGKPVREEEGLTARQREILQLVAEGRLSKEIAYILGISVKTVDFHRSNIMMKLGAHSAAELTKIAIEQGLIVTTGA